MIVYLLWDLGSNAVAHDPLARAADGLCPLAVYRSMAFAGRAADRARAMGMRVEIRPDALGGEPVAAELDELEPTGGHPLRRESSPFVGPAVAALYPRGGLQARSEREADG